MKIHLKRNEKLFINGAVIMLDRRGSIELLNDAQFLLQSHIMQQEDAKRPLEQIYFITQMMLMDPANASLIMELFRSYIQRLKIISPSEAYMHCLVEVEKMVEALDYFGALKLLRKSFALDEQGATMPEAQKTEVAA